VLPRVCEMDDSVRITLVAPVKCRQLPKHPHITHRKLLPVACLLRPARLWNRFTPQAKALSLGTSVGNGRHRIWHSTYYTCPGTWSGAQVVTVYDCIHERYPDLYDRPQDDRFREQKKRAIERADTVICISETTRAELEHFYGPLTQPVRVIPSGLDHNVFRPRKPLGVAAQDGQAAPFLLYLGGRMRYKNFQVLVRAYSSWSARDRVGLVVVGSPWSPQEEQELYSRGISNQVRLLSEVSDLELSRLYRQAVALVYPSLYEGFGIPLLEAMACGCPVVASRIPSTIEVAGDCPFYFEPTSEESLREALDTALAQGRASPNVAKGLERCRSFSWDNTASQTLEVYHALSASA